jgi:arsenate reductase
MPVTIYHNPKCSKSRQALQLLRDNGIEPTIVEYLKTPPDAKTLTRLLNMLGLKPRELMRIKEPEYKQHRLDKAGLSDAALIDAMVRVPKLIERPIVVNGGRAALGRPPEKVLEVL